MKKCAGCKKPLLLKDEVQPVLDERGNETGTWRHYDCRAVQFKRGEGANGTRDHGKKRKEAI